MVASLGNFWLEGGNNVVKGGEIFALELASGLRIISCKVIPDVLFEGLSCSDGENGLEDRSITNVIPGNHGVRSSHNQVGVQSVRTVLVFCDDGVVRGSFVLLWVVVVGHVWVVNVGEEVLNLLSHVVDLRW